MIEPLILRPSSRRATVRSVDGSTRRRVGAATQFLRKLGRRQLTEAVPRTVQDMAALDAAQREKEPVYDRSSRSNR